MQQVPLIARFITEGNEKAEELANKKKEHVNTHRAKEEKEQVSLFEH